MIYDDRSLHIFYAWTLDNLIANIID